MKSTSVGVQTEVFSVEQFGVLSNCSDTDKHILEYCDLSALYSMLYTNKTLSRYSNTLILSSMNNVIKQIGIRKKNKINVYCIPGLTFENMDNYFSERSAIILYTREIRVFKESYENYEQNNCRYNIRKHRVIASRYIFWIITHLRILYSDIGDKYGEEAVCFQEIIDVFGIDISFIIGYEDKKQLSNYKNIPQYILDKCIEIHNNVSTCFLWPLRH
jgi:hypothetical protein